MNSSAVADNGQQLAAALLGKQQQVAVRRAALHIQDAWSGMERVHPREGNWVRRIWLLHLALYWPVQIALLLLLLLGFFEEPAWLAGRGSAAYNVTLYPVSGIPMLPSAASYGIEAPLLAVLCVDAACSAGAQGLAMLLGARRKLLYLLALLLAIVEACLAASGLNQLVAVSRLAPFLRLSLVVLQSETLLSQLSLIWRTLPKIGGVLLVLCTFLLASAWAAVLLFQGDEAFNGLGVALWSLFICLTTANFPDVMMSNYDSYRPTIFFFAPFLLLGNFFLLNLVLAVVVQVSNVVVQARPTVCIGLASAASA